MKILSKHCRLLFLNGPCQGQEKVFAFNMISHAVLENADLPEGIKRPAEVAPEGEPVAKRSEPPVDGDDPEHVPHPTSPWMISVVHREAH